MPNKLTENSNFLFGHFPKFWNKNNSGLERKIERPEKERTESDTTPAKNDSKEQKNK